MKRAGVAGWTPIITLHTRTICERLRAWDPGSWRPVQLRLAQGLTHRAERERMNQTLHGGSQGHRRQHRRYSKRLGETPARRAHAEDGLRAKRSRKPLCVFGVPRVRIPPPPLGQMRPRRSPTVCSPTTDRARRPLDSTPPRPVSSPRRQHVRTASSTEHPDEGVPVGQVGVLAARVAALHDPKLSTTVLAGGWSAARRVHSRAVGRRPCAAR